LGGLLTIAGLWALPPQEFSMARYCSKIKLIELFSKLSRWRGKFNIKKLWKILIPKHYHL
jgi:hypothetical protein